MKKAYVMLVLAVVLMAGVGGVAPHAHAQTATAPETLSATDMNVLGKALSVFKSVLDGVQARLDAHTIPESAFPALDAALEGMKGSLLTIRTTITQGVSESAPVAITQESPSVSLNTANQSAPQAGTIAVVPAQDASAAQPQSASVGLIAQHPTISVWVGLIIFVIIIGVLLFLRTRSDSDKIEESGETPASSASKAMPPKMAAPKNVASEQPNL